MITKSTDGAVRVLSLSYGKDSMACLGALEKLGWPLDRIVTVDVWATDDILADLPPMVEFKDYADRVIQDRYGIAVEHYYATNKDKSKRTFEQRFYAAYNHKCQGVMRNNALGENGHYGFPSRGKNWCNSQLKMSALNRVKREQSGCVQYVGIALDEPNRFHTLSEDVLSPLVEIGWTELDCRKWCEENLLLSPIYTQIARGGCWFCYNQSVQQLRLLRKQYPDLWALMLKWDADSPTTFHSDGHTVHDFDRRFELEDAGVADVNGRFRWSMLG